MRPNRHVKLIWVLERNFHSKLYNSHQIIDTYMCDHVVRIRFYHIRFRRLLLKLIFLIAHIEPIVLIVAKINMMREVTKQF